MPFVPPVSPMSNDTHNRGNDWSWDHWEDQWDSAWDGLQKEGEEAWDIVANETEDVWEDVMPDEEIEETVVDEPK
jgi:hypothetical protein